MTGKKNEGNYRKYATLICDHCHCRLRGRSLKSTGKLMCVYLSILTLLLSMRMNTIKAKSANENSDDDDKHAMMQICSINNRKLFHSILPLLFTNAAA